MQMIKSITNTSIWLSEEVTINQSFSELGIFSHILFNDQNIIA